MIQILEYIAENYIWFLGVAFLILLAIIGYYADETNFGLGKNIQDDNKIKPNDTIDVDKQNDDENKEVIAENKNENELSSEFDDNLENFEIPEALSTESSSLITDSHETIDNQNLADETLAVSAVPEENIEKNSTSLLDEESFNKFNEEFESILPKKDLISNDLLSDIEDLELDKTQKFDLSDISTFGEIELPKIKQLDKEEQDIWKF